MMSGVISSHALQLSCLAMCVFDRTETVMCVCTGTYVVRDTFTRTLGLCSGVM
jgi:hypothetical protein